MSPDKGRSKSGRTEGSRRARKPSANPMARARAAQLGWVIKPASEQARKEWESALLAEPELMAIERERLRTRPMDRSDNPRRTAQLKYRLATRTIDGKVLPQWQREVTGSGRVWYCPDKETGIVWITKAELRHPGETD